MNKAQKLFEKVKKEFDKYEPKMDHINQMEDRGIRDVLNKKNWAYYQWSACLVKLLRPQQIVELGGAMGVWCVVVLSELLGTSKLYSITLAENGLEFSFIKRDYSNLVKVIGDDLDLNNWPQDMEMQRTDIWFIDSLHEESHLRKELELYSPFFKKGAVILLDDIHINEGMNKVWLELPYEKYDASTLHIPSGFGICVI